MKFALIFLMAFVAVSQQFYLQRPNIPMIWLSPHPARYFMNNYRPLVAYNEDLNRDSENSQSNADGEQEEYPDTQSRIKGNRPSNIDIQPQSGRFLAGSFGNNDGYSYNANQNSNPFLRTYTTTTTSTSTSYSLSTSTSTSVTVTSTTTSTSTATIVSTATLSLTSVVRCVPSLQVSAIPVSCSRKKRGVDEEDNEEHHQFIISPSETLKLMPTNLPLERSERALPDTEDVTSSKDEVANVEVSQEDQKRAKRFFLLNRNFYTTSTVLTTTTSIIVIPTTTVSQSISTVTTYATATSTSYFFSNSTVTQTVNLLNPAPTAQCAAVAVAAVTGPPAVAAIPQCISCLPVGYIVCPASG